MFTLETDGNVVMYTTEDFPLGMTNYAYWSTQTSVDGGFQLYYNRSGHIYIEADNRSIANEIVSPNFPLAILVGVDEVSQMISSPTVIGAAGTEEKHNETLHEQNLQTGTKYLGK
ncbi:hypothetical protein QYF36_024558 [Acer negundo]|nr:hypothetical protein QYF36_024558 [Acer negundo]